MYRFSHGTARRLLIRVALMSLCATPVAAKSSSQQFDIPSQSLDSAINEFSAQSGFRVLFPDAPALHRNSRPIAGKIEPDTALKSLLEDSGLYVRSKQDGVITLSLADAAPQTERPAEKTAPTEVDDQSNGVGVEQIVVTAQRRKQRLLDIPATIAIKTSEQLANAGVTTTADLPRVVPGLVFTYTGAWAQPNMRGVSTTVTGPGSDNPVAIYLDGVYQGSQVGDTFDLPDVERVVVLKGPQGTLFGRNATGGAIQIFTKKPTFYPTGSMTATAGAYVGGEGSQTAAKVGFKGYVSGPLSDKIAGSLAWIYNYNDGYETNVVTGKRFGQMTNELVRGKLLYQPTQSISFTLTAYYSQRNDRAAQSVLPYANMTVATKYPDAILPTRPWQVGFDYQPNLYVRTWGTSLLGSFDLGFGTLTALSSYLNTDNHEHVDVDAAYSPLCLAAGACINYDVKVPDWNFSEEVILSSNQLGRFKFVVGANAFIDDGTEPAVVNDFSYGLPLVPGLTNSGPAFQSDILVKTRAYAAFSEVDYKVLDNLTLTLGGRVSLEHKTGYGAYVCCDTSVLPEFVDKKWTSFTPHVSLTYDVTDNTSVYATYSRGFKSGVIPYSNFSAPAANPEKITAYEVGMKTSGRNYSFNAAGFYYDYTDLQVQITQKYAPILNNAASAMIWGFDIDGSLQLTNSLSGSLAVSYLPEAKFTKYPNAVAFGLPITPYGLSLLSLNAAGGRLFKTPRVTASASLDYDTTLNGSDELTANLSLYYSSKFYYEPSYVMQTDAFATLGLRVGYQPSGSDFKFGVYGNNLTDSAHINQAIPSQTANSVNYAPPREIGVFVKYAY